MRLDPRDPCEVSQQPSHARLLATTLLAITSSILPAFLTGAVAVQLRLDIGLDEAGLGLAIAVFFGSAACSSVLGGQLTQRLGAAVALRSGLLIAAAADIGIALLARSPLGLCLFLAVAGLGNAVSQPAANLLLADRLPSERLGLAIGLKQSGMPFAVLLGGIAVPVLAETVGWQSTYVAAAGIAVLTAVLISNDCLFASAAGSKEALQTPIATLSLLSFGMFFGAAAASALGSFLVISAVTSGLDSGEAGLLLATGSACGIAVRVLMGARADHRPDHQLKTVAIMLMLGAGAFVLLAEHSMESAIIGTPLVFATGWAWPGLFNFAIVRANPKAAGSATGITQTGVYLGAFSGPLVFGLIVQDKGYSSAWLVFAGAAVCAAVVFRIGDRRLEPTIREPA